MKRTKIIKKITAVAFSGMLMSAFCLESATVLPLIAFGVCSVWMGLVIAANAR